MTLSEIIERLEKANGPSKELDFWLSVRVFDPCDYTTEELQRDIDLVGIDGMHIDAPFTSSVDAAIALAEKVLPGEPVIMGWAQTLETRPWARVGAWSAPDATGQTPALALVTAVLSALRAKEGTPHE